MELYITRKEICDLVYSKSKDEEIEFDAHAQFERMKSMFSHISNKLSGGNQKHLIHDLNIFFTNLKTKYLVSQRKDERFHMKKESSLKNPLFETIELKEMDKILPETVTGRQNKLHQDKKEGAQTLNPRDLSTISILLLTDRSYAQRRKLFYFLSLFKL